MTELLTLIGSAGSGKLLGLAGDFIANRAQEKAEREEREFQRDLAFKGQLHEYMQSVHQEVDHRPSLMSKTLCFLYILFGITACSACLWCFASSYGEMVTIKDPDAAGGGLGLFGIFRIDFNPKTSSELSLAGVGYLILHPILFILSMVSTGARAPRGRR